MVGQRRRTRPWQLWSESRHLGTLCSCHSYRWMVYRKITTIEYRFQLLRVRRSYWWSRRSNLWFVVLSGCLRLLKLEITHTQIANMALFKKFSKDDISSSSQVKASVARGIRSKRLRGGHIFITCIKRIVCTSYMSRFNSPATPMAWRHRSPRRFDTQKGGCGTRENVSLKWSTLRSMSFSFTWKLSSWWQAKNIVTGQGMCKWSLSTMWPCSSKYMMVLGYPQFAFCISTLTWCLNSEQTRAP